MEPLGRDFLHSKTHHLKVIYHENKITLLCISFANCQLLIAN